MTGPFVESSENGITVNVSDLRRFLVEKFSDIDIRSLAFDLGIQVDDLVAKEAGRVEKVQALIEYCQRTDQLDSLEVAARRERSGLIEESRSRSTIVDISVPAGQFDRLAGKVDTLRDDVAGLSTKFEVHNVKLERMNEQIDEINTRLQSGPTPVLPLWQSWLLGIIGILMTLVLLYVTLRPV